jgi:uncharacterized protein (DUF58 family)
MKKSLIAMLAATAILLALALSIDFVLLWRLFLASLLVLLAGMAWTFIGWRSVSGHASPLPDHCHAGDALEQAIALHNHWILPRMLEIKTAGDLPGNDAMTAMALAPGKEQSLDWRLRCGRRGSYHAGAFRVSIRDPFNLIVRGQVIGLSRHLTVYPAIVPLPHFSPFLASDAGYHANRWLDTGASQDASRVREYVAGDSLNRINWRATAHTGNLMVKVFDPYRSNRSARSVWVALDLQQACQAGQGLESTEEYGITLAASILDKFHGAGLGVGLVLSQDKPLVIPPENGDAQIRTIMEALALARTGGEVGFEQTIHQQARYFSPDTVLVAITPSTSPGLDSVLRQVAGRGVASVAVLLDSGSFGGKGNPAAMAHRLTAGGVQVHTVCRGDDLYRALDSRLAAVNL